MPLLAFLLLLASLIWLDSLFNAVVHSVADIQAADSVIADADISVDCVHIRAGTSAVACCPFVAGIPAVTGDSSVVGVLPLILLLSFLGAAVTCLILLA